MKRLENYEEEKIKELLLFRKVTKVVGDALYLDNGTELKILANEGCGGCSSGWYEVTELNECDNVITSVEICCDDLNDEYESYSYKIFVFAEDKKIKLLQVDGTDGNGYYGTGYAIEVRLQNERQV